MRGDVPDIPESDRADGCPHPRKVYSLIGHQKAEHRFIKATSSGHMHHAWLLSGGPGIGKATLAYRMIRSILGGQSRLQTSLDIPDSDPVAQRIESLGHGDFLLVRRPYDRKTGKLRSEIPVAEARRVSEFFSKRASEGGWRVCLIDCLDEMNHNGENAILKTLEEPPERAVLILLTHNPGRLLPTTRSRCLYLPLREVPSADIRVWLGTYAKGSTEPTKELAVQLSRGAPGRALALTRNAKTVLEPIRHILERHGRRETALDMRWVDNLSTVQNRYVRSLFWEALQDVIAACARTAGGVGWELPLVQPELNSVSRWIDYWKKIRHLQSCEAELNMDRKVVMMDALGNMPMP